ncbi:DUF4139 domain-containing protein [Mariniluteicoccus endophyticus]
MAPEQQNHDSHTLSVREVVVQRNGVGYFIHRGTVSGDEEMRLSVAPEAIDDLLQSVVVADPGGAAPTVGFPAEDPLSRVLASYSLDLSQSDSLVAVLRQARGEEVRVRTSEDVTGRILAVDTIADPRGPERSHLVLNSADGLRRIELGEIRSLRFTDERVAADLEAALTAIAGHRRTEEREVTVRLRGDGEREVELAYVRPMPVWKTAYRLTLGDDGYADLQGWAIVDNPTSMDLADVTVSVVAGHPMSFVTNLATPRHVDRPRVDPAVTRSVVPSSYDYLDVPNFEVGAAPAAAPRAAMRAAGKWMAAEAHTVEPEVDTAEVGLDVAYTVREPVTIPRHSSAMLPIIQHRLPMSRLSVYDCDVDSEHPMRGLLLRNDSDLQLTSGPVTVLDGGSYAGTAQLDDLLPGGDQIITYARDLAVKVHHATSPAEHEVETSVVNGLLRTTTTQTDPVGLTLSSTAAGDRLVMVVLRQLPGTKVVVEGPAPQQVGEHWRLGVLLAGRDPYVQGDDEATLPVQARAAAREEARLRVGVRRVRHSDTQATLADEAVLRHCLTSGSIDPRRRDLLEQIADLTAERAEVQRSQEGTERRREEIAGTQERIRQNMANLASESGLYQRYVGDLNRQEDELAELARRAGELRERADELWRRGQELAARLR